MKTGCSVVIVPARAQATCRRASVRKSSTRVSSARSSSSLAGQNKTIHSLSKKSTSTTAVKAPSSSNFGSSRSFSVVANAVVPTGDASPPPVVFNVSAAHALSRSCLFFLYFSLSKQSISFLYTCTIAKQEPSLSMVILVFFFRFVPV